MGQWSTWCVWLPDCDVLVNFVSPQGIRRMRDKAKPRHRKWDPELGDIQSDFDTDIFYDLLADAAVGDWRGLTDEIVEEHCALTEDERREKFPVGPDGTIPYTKERARLLLENSTSFDKFLSLHSADLRAHEAARKAALAKNSVPSPAAPSGSAAAAEGDH